MQNTSNSIYDFHPAVAELYDDLFFQRDDVDFILKLIGERRNWHILEPFCGTGRILLQLAAKGHFLYGIDNASNFLQRLQCKSYLLASQYRKNVDIRFADALHTSWSNDFHLIVLAANCFYELPTPEAQELCIRKAYNALRSGGFVFIDNDHMEGSLSESWQNYNACEAFPTGFSRDGTEMKSTRQAIWFDVSRRLIKFQRQTFLTEPDGSIQEFSLIQQKHPVSKLEVEHWLINSGFSILRVFGDYQATIYNKNSPRAVFWAQKI
ncbi:MAG: class I SAM-dependent methyltransferase [Candidatus Cloacimonetes bacterium]|nr:class I SAM-dependent methyltransferase [Candidatus Cloacimonadota bacterium]